MSTFPGRDVEEQKDSTNHAGSGPGDMQTLEIDGSNKLTGKAHEDSYGEPSSLYTSQSVSSVASPTQWLFSRSKANSVFLDPTTAHRQMWLKAIVRSVVALQTLGHSMMIIILPKLLIIASAGNVGRAGGLAGGAHGLQRGISFLTAPLWGTLSDSFGRKPIIVTCVIGMTVAALVLGLRMDLGALIFFYAAYGTFDSVVTTAYAVCTDIMSESKQAHNKLVGAYGKINVSVCIGFLLGPLIGGILARKLGLRFPIFFATGCVGLAVLLALCMPESLDQSKRKALNLQHASPFYRIRVAWRFPRFRIFLVAYVFNSIAESVYSIMAIYLMKRYHLTPVSLGMFITITFALQGAIQASLSKLVPKRISEEKCVLFGAIFHTVGMIVVGFSDKKWAMFMLSIAFAMAGPRNPALLSALTSNVPFEVRGLLQGAAQSIRAASMVIGGPSYGQLFQRYGHINMGAPMFAAALFDIFTFLAAIVSFRVLRKAIAKGEIEVPRNGEENDQVAPATDGIVEDL